MAKSQSQRGPFNTGKNYVFGGGKKLISEGYSKAKGASRTAIGKRK